VVKLVSSQPYRVGRWLCVEFSDDENVEMSDNKVDNEMVTNANANTNANSIAEQNHNNNNSDLNTQQSNISNDNNSDERLQSVEGVAIDNKIEQAMDLVKSHLMFAVREEVDVLRERITELNARVEQLEHENALLRAHVPPETLNLLQLN
jgi:polyhydroxyalkanoate synthesis regulator phasin